ncbi:hypothetical protein D9757_010687 [Collybiopsis confluens]|uniref:Uncharacterized protein n=1 Tax=Collybiopsis confluens TaxID=2823264 RepID=A0A8H5M3F8_9AGAR|nr:hypothetical protein D9757_010687 [Collybiopsis confluens]
MGQTGMYILLLLISWISAAGALSISFPSNGVPIAGSESQNVSWKRDKHDPNAQFFFQKIKLDQSTGPTSKSAPVPVPYSQNKAGMSPLAFNRSGLFEILAVNKQDGQPFWTTEISVAPNPTSTASSPSKSNGHGSKYKSGPDDTGTNNSPSTTLSVLTAFTATSFTIPNPPTSSSVSASDSPQTASGASTRPNRTAAIVGAVLGSVAFFFILGAILLWFRYRTRRATSNFVQARMTRDYNRNLDEVGAEWSIPSSEKEKSTLGQDYSLPPTRRSSLRPIDSVSNIGLNTFSILPPVPVARSLAGTNASGSSNSSSVRRTRDKNALRLSISTMSASTGTSGSIFPVPALPPRTRTDRQMMIEEDIQRLQARMLFLQGRGDGSPISHLEREEELKQIHAKVDRLKAVHESRWALGLTDEVPDGSNSLRLQRWYLYSIVMRYSKELSLVGVLCLLSSSTSLSISFPSNGVPTAGSDSQNVSWKRDKDDPNADFFFQKIKLDQSNGPTAKSTPVPVPYSQNEAGMSPLAFNRAGLYEILAVNVQDGQPFWTTEITVVPNPTSTASPPFRSGGGHDSKNGSDLNYMGMNSGSSTISDITAASTSASSISSSLTSASGPSTTPIRTAAIIGAVIGVIAFFVFLGVTLLFVRYRARRISPVKILDSEQLAHGAGISPFMDNEPISPTGEKHRHRVSVPRIPGAREKSHTEFLPAVEASSSRPRTPMQRVQSATATLRQSIRGQNHGSAERIRHQDSGWRSRRNQDSATVELEGSSTELPPEYSAM